MRVADWHKQINYAVSHAIPTVSLNKKLEFFVRVRKDTKAKTLY